MRKLTSKERKLILKCAKVIAEYQGAWSCNELREELDAKPTLIAKYTEFFDPSDEDVCGGWVDSDGDSMGYNSQDWRLLCLLLFAHVG